MPRPQLRLTVSASSEVTFETTGIEVVMVLDNTGSMGSSNKLADMKTAARDMVDILFDGEATSSTVKVGLVPFSGAVNIGNNVTNIASYVNDPTAYDTTDDSVAVGGRWDPFYWADTPYPYTSPYYDANNWHYNSGTTVIDFNLPQNPGPNKDCPREVTPLTNTKATVDTEIDAMWAAGYTHINVGRSGAGA